MVKNDQDGRKRRRKGSASRAYMGAIRRAWSDEPAIEAEQRRAQWQRVVEQYIEVFGGTTPPPRAVPRSSSQDKTFLDRFDVRLRELHEKAKRLSITPGFIEALDHFRVFWRIKKVPPPTEEEARTLTPWMLLQPGEGPYGEGGSGASIAYAPAEEMWEDLQSRLYEPWGLSEIHDSGLVAVALRYGLTPNVLSTNWDAVRWIVACTAVRGAALVLSMITPEREREFASLAVLHLLSMLPEQAINLELLSASLYLQNLAELGARTCQNHGVPESEALALLNHLLPSWAKPAQESDLPESWPDELRFLYLSLSSGVTEEMPYPAEVSIRLDCDYSEQDVKRVLKQVESLRHELWLPETVAEPSLGEWETYERDYELMRIAEKFSSPEAIFTEYQRRYPKTDLAKTHHVQGTETVKKALWRMKKEKPWPKRAG